MMPWLVRVPLSVWFIDSANDKRYWPHVPAGVLLAQVPWKRR